jgi:ABC-2 type transport system permease protein
MLRIYQRFWLVNWAEHWQYRANLFMYILYWVVQPIVYIAVWTTIANVQGAVKGLTANDFTVYYIIMLVVDQITSETVFYNMSYKIQDGTMAGELIRPVHPILTNSLTGTLAFKALTTLVLIPIVIVLSLLFHPTFDSVSISRILMVIPALIIGFAVNFLITASITCVAFWTQRVWGLYRLYGIPLALFSGQFVPLKLLPKTVQVVAEYLPFQLSKHFPIQLILGNLSAQEIIRGYIVGLVWVALAWFIFQFAWSRGLQKFSAVGA